jgi:hypothetical protein
MYPTSVRRLATLLLLHAKNVAAADDSTEFTFNLFSDIAPEVGKKAH